MESELHLNLLGPPRVTLDRQAVPGLRAAKTQAMLYYVAVSQRPRSRPELAAMFWPEVNERRANSSLRKSLSILRRAVGAHLEITRHTVAINPSSSIWLDVAQFDALLKPRRGEPLDVLHVQTAVSLYQGDFLEGFAMADIPLFEQWVTVERERLREILLNALQALAVWHVYQSQYNDSLKYLARLLALDPIREVGHRLRMIVLAMSGQSGAALAHFDTCRRIMSEKLGIDPSPETVALYELILFNKLPKSGQQEIGNYLTDTELRIRDSSALKKAQVSDRPSNGMLPNVDWDDMPARVDLHGREDQLAQLSDWLTVERCRLVAVLGIGGIGKTALAAELTRRQADLAPEHHPDGVSPFDQIVWRSLVNAPPPETILDDWLQVLPDQQMGALPDNLEAKLRMLFQELQRQRCLLILDNVESILEGQPQSGQPKPGYDDYLQLFRRIAEQDHQSCLLFTSREAPQGLMRLLGDYPGVRLLRLDGLSADSGADLLRLLGLKASSSDFESIVNRYSGNPLALKVVADAAQELFAGDVNEFLRDEALIFDDIRGVLDQQFERLSHLEREILTWLAIEREPVPAPVLWNNLSHAPHRRQFLEALRSLQRHSLLEQSSESAEGDDVRFFLQNVIMEYATDRLVENICQELESGRLALLRRHALVKAHAKEYVVNSQRRLILQPVSDWLSARLGTVGALHRLNNLLENLQADAPQAPGYAGANILHLLLGIGADLSGYDFSRLAIWQADLRNTSLIDVAFRGCDLKGSLFRDTFGLIMSIAISPDGQLLAAGSSDGSITFWRLNEYEPYHIVEGHAGLVNSVAFSQDGRLLASASYDKTILLWDMYSGRSVRQLSGHTASIFSVAFSPDGKILFSASEDQTIRAWDVQIGRVRQQLQDGDDKFAAVAISPDGQMLAGGSFDGFLYLWEEPTGKLRYKIRAHKRKVQAVAFAHDGSTVATAGEDNQIHLWNVHDGAKRSSLSGHANWVLSIAFSPGDQILASGSADQTIRLWDIESGRTVRILGGYDNWVTGVAFNPDGNLVAGGSYDRRIRLWHVRSGRLLHILRGSLRWVDPVIFSPDGRLLASASFDKPVLLWDVQTGKLSHMLRGHSGSVRRLTFSPDSRTLAGGSDDNKIHLWDTNSGELQETLTGHQGFVRALAFSPDGHSLASAAKDRTLRMWEVSSGRQRFALQNVSVEVNFSISFSPDGQMLAYAKTDNTIGLADVDTGDIQPILLKHQTPVQLVRFSPDGSLLVTRAKDGVIRVWNVESNDAIDALQPRFALSTSKDDLWNLAFSPDGRLLAAQLEESSVGVWDLNDGQLCYGIEVYLHGEGCLDFSCDGALLITGSTEGDVRLWDSTSGEMRCSLEGHMGSVTSIAVNIDGDHIASSSADGTIRLWHIQSGSCLRIMTPSGPYAGMDITGATGLTPAQVAALQTLGAVSDNH